MLQAHSHGTLVVAQYVNDGIAVASDSLRISRRDDGIFDHSTKVQKLFLMDKRTVCALGDLSSCTGPDENEVDFGEVVRRAAQKVGQKPRGKSFQDKCDLVSSELDRILQKFRNSIAGYPEPTLSTLLFFGYQGRSPRLGVCQFAHEKETIVSIPYSQPIMDSELWVLGPSETIKARMAVEPKKVPKTNASVFSSPICSLMEAESFVRALVSDSIKDMQQKLGGAVQVVTIPRNPKMEPSFSECR